MSAYTNQIDRFQTRMIRHRALPFLAVKTGADKLAYAVRRHSHDTLSFGFVEKGSSLVQCEPFSFPLHEGDTLLIPPQAIHLCQPSDPDRFLFRMLYVDTAWLRESLGHEADALAPGSVSLSRPQRRIVAEFFKGFQSDPDPFCDETAALLFLDFLLSRVFALSGKEADTPLPPPASMAKVKDFLDQAFDRDIHLEDLAQIAGASKFAVVRRFRQLWQITPHAYVINQRILLAKTLLCQGKSVADTAADCGFFDQSHFVKTFKNFVGIRPADYA